jgi:hypothetical protein
MHDAFRRFLPLMLLGALSGCPRRESPPPRITLGPARTLADFATPVTAGDSRNSTFVVGTALGRVLLRGADGREAALGEPAAHEAPVVALALGVKERWLISAGGRSIATWSVARRGLVRRVAGPQTITAAVLAPDGATAYFGTEQGHVLRWRLGQPSAEPLRQLACAGSKLTRAQLRLPESKRCEFGAYVEPPQGGAICAYPITALALRGALLAAACREGTISFNDLPGGRRSFYLAGYLRTVTPVGAELMLLGRGEGELRLYDVPGGKVVRELQPAGAPDAAAVDGELLAVAHGHHLHVWHTGHVAALASLALPRRAVWASLRAGELRLLLEDGRFVAHSVSRQE